LSPILKLTNTRGRLTIVKALSIDGVEPGRVVVRREGVPPVTLDVSVVQVGQKDYRVIQTPEQILDMLQAVAMAEAHQPSPARHPLARRAGTGAPNRGRG